MDEQSGRGLSVRRVPVDGALAVEGRPDYADAFEVQWPGADGRTAEEWARSALEQAPSAVRRVILVVHRHVLRFRLASPSSPDHVLGWTVVTSEADLVRLQTSSPLARAVLVGQRVTATSTRLTTLVFFRRPVTARVVWALLSPLHRGIARYLLAREGRRSPAPVVT